jgi:hypothetical protein
MATNKEIIAWIKTLRKDNEEDLIKLYRMLLFLEKDPLTKTVRKNETEFNFERLSERSRLKFENIYISSQKNKQE